MNVAEEIGFCSSDQSVQAKYEEYRNSGVPHGMAQVLATRRFPRITTDSTFMKGKVNGNQFEKTPGLGDHYKQIAEKSGVSVTGKVYYPSLASFPGDPAAWISGRGDALALCKERGWSIEGDVTYKAPERSNEPTPSVGVADDIVERETQNVMSQDPGLKYLDAKEKVTKVLSGEEQLGFSTVCAPPPDAECPDW